MATEMNKYAHFILYCWNLLLLCG